MNEPIEEGFTVGMRDEEPMHDAALGLTAYGFDDAPVESFDQAIGLRATGSGQSMIDFMLGADVIDNRLIYYVYWRPPPASGIISNKRVPASP